MATRRIGHRDRAVAQQFMVGDGTVVRRQRVVRRHREQGSLQTRADLFAAVMEGAVQRVRPKAMTVAVILAGLAPIMVGSGTGSEVMQRIAAPMVGGMISAPLLSMFLMPVAYFLLRRRSLSDAGGNSR